MTQKRWCWLCGNKLPLSGLVLSRPFAEPLTVPHCLWLADGIIASGWQMVSGPAASSRPGTEDSHRHKAGTEAMFAHSLVLSFDVVKQDSKIIHRTAAPRPALWGLWCSAFGVAVGRRLAEKDTQAESKLFLFLGVSLNNDVNSSQNVFMIYILPLFC